MAKLHIIGGEKGGVGKSTMARLLAQYFIDHQLAFIGFDTDRSHATFSRFYGDFTSPLTMDDFASLDNILDAAHDQPQANIVVDLAAQTAKAFNEWLTTTDSLALCEQLQCEVFFWHVLDDSADGAFLLGKTLDAFAPSRVKLVVVQNAGRGDDFEASLASANVLRAQERHASFITLPRLHPTIAQKIDFNNISFWAAAHNATAMKFTERHRAKIWLNSVYEQLDPLLLP